MSTGHGNETSSGGQARPEADAPRPITYREAQDHYRSTIDARERFEELSNRDLMARARAVLQARGTYDPRQHGAGEYKPLTAAEHLELLAAGELLARHYRHPMLTHQALLAGASWPQVAAATGTDEAVARQAYREWADVRHRLYLDYEGKFGMNDAEHAAAITRAAEPAAGAAGPETEPEAGR